MSDDEWTCQHSLTEEAILCKACINLIKTDLARSQQRVRELEGEHDEALQMLLERELEIDCAYNENPPRSWYFCKDCEGELDINSKPKEFVHSDGCTWLALMRKAGLR